MNRVRPLALWLAAAIVAIVVLMAAGPSQAHEGHGLHEAAASASVLDLAPGDARTGLRHAAPDQAGDRSFGEIRRAEPGSSDPCCGSGSHASSCCCAIGLAPAPEPAVLRPGHATRPVPDNARGRPDIPLEALPEPPRPLA